MKFDNNPSKEVLSFSLKVELWNRILPKKHFFTFQNPDSKKNDSKSPESGMPA